MAFGAFGTLLGSDVWITNAGYQRALLPLFYFAPIALLRALPSLRRADDVGAAGDDTTAPSSASDGRGRGASGEVTNATTEFVRPKTTPRRRLLAGVVDNPGDAIAGEALGPACSQRPATGPRS